MNGIADALTKLHKRLKFSHNDVRLPNICFNESYQPVFIDIDRCFDVTQLYPMYGGSVSTSSCMYCIGNTFKTGDQTDFSQLGWMVIQVIDPKEDFYARNWEDESVTIRRNSLTRGASGYSSLLRNLSVCVCVYVSLDRQNLHLAFKTRQYHDMWASYDTF